ncbi:hypothetical protein EH222_01825 [candidate division KSB1 bacterium]|nr:MAG: hypothetical protein EH222_01825 [candidate division KSB1 bacterium]
MDAKLTLKLDKAVIEKAKSFAKSNKTSLSSLVQGFFERLPEKETQLNLSPTVKELVGVLEIENESEIDVYKEQYLSEKYLHE